MKKVSVLVLCLAILSLACLGTAGAARLDAEAPVGTSPILTNVPATLDDLPQTMAPTLAHVERCAVVVADSALHLRGGPSVDDSVLAWLRRGDVVEVLDRIDPDWWRVGFDDFEGFARSRFLEEVECE